MKRFVLILFLVFGIGLLWLGASLTRWESARDQERMLGGLKFIEERIEALESGKQVIDAFHLPSLEKEGRSNNWIFTGLVEVHGATGEPQLRRYIAKLTNLCVAYSDPRCWRLESLDLSDELGIDSEILKQLRLDEIEPALGKNLNKYSAEAPNKQSSMDQIENLKEGNLLGDENSVDNISDRISNSSENSNISHEDKTPASVETEKNNEAQEIILNTGESRKTMIVLIQRQLNRLGYDSGPIDGKLGPRTKAAIEAYQHDHGLNIDNQPSEKFLDHLTQSVQQQISGP